MKKIPFEKMTKPQKRVAIAKDVLKQVKLGKIKPYIGTYLQPSINWYTFANDINILQKVPSDPCEACLLGSCLLSRLFVDKSVLVSKKVHSV